MPGDATSKEESDENSEQSEDNYDSEVGDDQGDEDRKAVEKKLAISRKRRLTREQSVLSQILTVEEDPVSSKGPEFFEMDTLERMTDPYRRPSINKNDEILPLPSSVQAKIDAQKSMSSQDFN